MTARIEAGGERGRGGIREVSRPLAFSPTADLASESEGVSSVPLGLLVARHAETLTLRTLAPRQTFLNRRSPKDDAAWRTRKDVQDRKSKPWLILLRLALADLEDGVPAKAVSETFRFAAELIDAMASERRQSALYAPSLVPLLERENARQALSDRAERAVCEDQDCPERLQALLDAHLAERAEIDRCADAIRERLARLALTQAHTQGGR